MLYGIMVSDRSVALTDESRKTVLMSRRSQMYHHNDKKSFISEACLDTATVCVNTTRNDNVGGEMSYSFENWIKSKHDVTDMRKALKQLRVYTLCSVSTLKTMSAVLQEQYSREIKTADTFILQ